VKLLHNHRAVVTGASSGIGQEYARQLAAMGCDLVIAARRLDRLNHLAGELRSQYGVKVESIEIDLTQPSSAKSLFEQATANHSEITILVSNAGIGKYGSFLDFPVKDHLSTMQVNAVIPTELTYYFLEHMRKHRKKSYIKHVASIAAFQPTGFFTVYSGTKGYLRYFSETLAFELKGTNISVTCTCPGGTYTEFMLHSGQKITNSGHRFMMSSQVVVRSSLKAMLREQNVFVPGVLNKLACFFPRILPRKASLHLAFQAMNKAVQREETKQPLSLK